MKAKSRKIWSLPIAVLALALMLVGALAVSGIVQAQSANIVTGDKVIIHDASSGVISAVTTLTVSPSSPDDAEPEDVVLGLDEDQYVVAVELARGGDSEFFVLTGADTEEGEGDDFPGLLVNDTTVPSDGAKPVEFPIPIAASGADYRDIDDDDTDETYAAYMVHPDTKSVYTVDVLIYIDRNTQNDSGKGANFATPPPKMTPLM